MGEKLEGSTDAAQTYFNTFPNIYGPSKRAGGLSFPVCLLTYYMGCTLPYQMATGIQDIDSQDINKNLQVWVLFFQHIKACYNSDAGSGIIQDGKQC